MIRLLRCNPCIVVCAALPLMLLSVRCHGDEAEAPGRNHPRERPSPEGSVYGPSGIPGTGARLVSAGLNSSRGQPTAASESFVRRLTGGARYLISFPSPRPSGYPSNDTVWADYFRPEGPGPHPAVIILHSWGSKHADTEYSFCTALMRRGIASVMVHLPFHLRRRLPRLRSGVGMIVTDPKVTARNFEQAFAEVQWVARWLAGRSEIDAQRLGIAGISLGAIIAAALLGREASLKCGALILGGADLTEIAEESPLFRYLWKKMRARGLTHEQLRDTWRNIEPLTWLPEARDKPVLVIRGVHDWVIPRLSAQKLQHAFSKPKVVRINAGHFGGDLVKTQAVELVSAFFRNVLCGDHHSMERLTAEVSHGPAPKLAIVSCKPARVQLALLAELFSFPRNRMLSIDIGVTHNGLLAGVSCDMAKVAGNFAFDLGTGYSFQPGHEPRNYVAISLHF